MLALRVAVGWLRRVLLRLAAVSAASAELRSRGAAGAKSSCWRVDEQHAAVLAFLADGESW